MLTYMDKAVGRAAKILLNFGAFVAYPVLICVVLTDICLRTFFNNPLPWGMEVSGLLLIICFFAPACACEEEKAHIALDFLSVRFSPFGKRLVDMLGCLAGAVWTGLLSYRNFTEIPAMMQYGETGVEFHYPLWPLRLFLAVALLLLFFRLCLDAITLFGTLKREDAA